MFSQNENGDIVINNTSLAAIGEAQQAVAGHDLPLCDHIVTECYDVVKRKQYIFHDKRTNIQIA